MKKDATTRKEKLKKLQEFIDDAIENFDAPINEIRRYESMRQLLSKRKESGVLDLHSTNPDDFKG